MIFNQEFNRLIKYKSVIHRIKIKFKQKNRFSNFLASSVYTEVSFKKFSI